MDAYTYTDSEVENELSIIKDDILNWAPFDEFHLAKVSLWGKRVLTINTDDYLSTGEYGIDEILYNLYTVLQESLVAEVIDYLDYLKGIDNSLYVFKEILTSDNLETFNRHTKDGSLFDEFFTKYLDFSYKYLDETDVVIYSNYIDYHIQSPLEDSMCKDTKEEAVDRYLNYLFEKMMETENV